MPRGSTSRADRLIIATLADQGVRVTSYQLERWRRLGLIPRNKRHGLGRGRGSVAEIAPDTISAVETVARFADQAHLNWKLVNHFYIAAGRAEERARSM